MQTTVKQQFYRNPVLGKIILILRQEHGTLVGDVSGNWQIMYHPYEKEFHALGRQTLMLPIVWTNDRWFRVPDHVMASDSIRIL